MSFADDHLIPLIDSGLGNSAYLVDLGDGRALAVDASRDLRALRSAASERGLAVAFAADTHLHADFLSGAVQLAADGAAVLASAAGRRAFPHIGLADGDEKDLGGLTLRALATPGHTDEHLSFLLLDGPRELGVFTGGSLIVGSAARTDLLGPQHTEELARAQYRSLHRLAALPDETSVWPTHGAGSFCSAPPGAERTSTVGAERRTNPLLAAPDEDAFVRQLLGSLGSYPAYFDRLAEVNRRGPALVTGEPQLPRLEPQRVRAALAAGAVLVDVRPIAAFAAGHVPGSVSIALRSQFATWLGWLVDPETPVIVVRDRDQDVAEILWQALKIGYDTVIGELELSRWPDDLRTLPLVDPGAVTGRPVLDIRQHSEFTAGHLPGALHVELGALADSQLSQEPYLVMCGHGERAATAASLLARAGHRDLAVLSGGAQDWAEAAGRNLVEGE